MLKSISIYDFTASKSDIFLLLHVGGNSKNEFFILNNDKKDISNGCLNILNSGLKLLIQLFKLSLDKLTSVSKTL